ncbi:hypothetical protein GT204_29215 [Streptomyces sp. SID4919]|uniref:hypothetical protein n=1 Tax=unclassified Streptomyces TaxID=2593676 RepID=UPI000823C1D4|nr:MULTISPECIES: hypothetical protein [unclassified Streptomyces]MYY12864.1 hypothetical protein [Streptomyces sp. SID4919]SCK21626.1 hypothetical protein YW7DRAFT_01584 [Streptomyces sp. AmelKG-E11A]
MEAVIAVVALLFVLLVALGVYATVKVVGAAKRGVDRTIHQARRTVEDTTLKAKSYTQPGAAGELAQLRLKLRTSMRATQDALQAAVGEDESLRESLSLFDRLSTHGHELDRELKRLETEPDRTRLSAALPEMRERTDQITKSADALRWAARDRAHRFANDDLDSLSLQIDMEAGALRHWTTEAAPGAQDPAGAPSPASTASAEPAKDGPAPWPAAAGPEGRAGAQEQTWPAGGAEPAAPAIAPPVARPTYSWEKKPRPESTT